MKNLKLILKEAVLSVIVLKLLVFSLMGLLHFFESLNPLELAIKEIDFLDLYYNQDNKSNEPESMDVVFINSGSIPDTSLTDFRNNFSNVLNSINKQSPAVLGIDIEFESKTDPLTDTNLKEALDSFPHLVLAEYGGKNAITSDKAIKADISLIGDSAATKKYYQLKSHDTLSFALAVAKEFLKHDISVPSTPILIDYKYDYSHSIDWKKLNLHESSIPTIEASEILEKIDDPSYLKRMNNFMKDKIVLIGHIGKDSIGNPYDIEDKHIVPARHQNIICKVPSTTGIFIHAQVLEMLINDRLIYEFNGIWKGLLEFIILVLVALLYVYLAHHSIWYKPIVLPISFILIFALIYFALLLRDMNIYWAVGGLNLQIVILIEAVEFYEPISIWLNKKLGIKTYFSHEKNH